MEELRINEALLGIEVAKLYPLYIELGWLLEWGGHIKLCVRELLECCDFSILSHKVDQSLRDALRLIHYQRRVLW